MLGATEVEAVDEAVGEVVGGGVSCGPPVLVGGAGSAGLGRGGHQVVVRRGFIEAVVLFGSDALVVVTSDGTSNRHGSATGCGAGGCLSV